MILSCKFKQNSYKIDKLSQFLLQIRIILARLNMNYDSHMPRKQTKTPQEHFCLLRSHYCLTLQ